VTVTFSWTSWEFWVLVVLLLLNLVRGGGTYYYGPECNYHPPRYVPDRGLDPPRTDV
jgi:hypothetical protein